MSQGANVRSVDAITIVLATLNTVVRKILPPRRSIFVPYVVSERDGAGISDLLVQSTRCTDRNLYRFDAHRRKRRIIRAAMKKI